MGKHELVPLEQQIAAAESELRTYDALAVVLADPHGLLVERLAERRGQLEAR